MSAVRQAKGIWSYLPCMANPVGAERLRVLLPILWQIHEETQERRKRVLRHEWARKQLCVILQLERPEQWNGYVPPSIDGEERRNDSPSRKALIELLRDIDELDRVPVGAGV